MSDECNFSATYEMNDPSIPTVPTVPFSGHLR